MSTSILVPSHWMVKDGSKSTDDVVKDNAMGGWVKIHPNGVKELLHCLKSPGNAAPYITSVTKQANGTYSSPESLSFSVVFNENVTVTGLPKIQVYTEAGVLYNLDYASGTGTTTLVFTGAPAGIANGTLLVVPEVLVEPAGATIKDASGNICNNDFQAAFVQPTAILMSTVEIVSVTNMADGEYENTDTLTFEVEFTGVVTVGGTGTPKLTIYTEVGSQIDLPVTAGSGTDTLTFSGAATAAADGQLVVVETLKLATSTLSDANANPVYRVFPADYEQPDITIVTA